MSSTRRDFLQMVGAAGIGAAVGPLLGTLGGGGRAEARVSHPTPEAKTRQWAMVVDLRKCEGCTTIGKPPQCTEACIKEHYVPEGQKWIKVNEEELAGGTGTFFRPTPCMQCENAPCTSVCPVMATYHNEEGIVLIDHDRCIGCRFCMAACPYQARSFNWGEPKPLPQGVFVEYSPEYPVPYKRGTVVKCMFCAHRARQGRLPACVEGCPMRALYFGDLNEDLATNGEEVVQLSKFLADNNATPYKEDLGTRPRVFYIKGHGQEFGRSPEGGVGDQNGQKEAKAG